MVENRYGHGGADTKSEGESSRDLFWQSMRAITSKLKEMGVVPYHEQVVNHTKVFIPTVNFDDPETQQAFQEVDLDNLPIVYVNLAGEPPKNNRVAVWIGETKLLRPSPKGGLQDFLSWEEKSASLKYLCLNVGELVPGLLSRYLTFDLPQRKDGQDTSPVLSKATHTSHPHDVGYAPEIPLGEDFDLDIEKVMLLSTSRYSGSVLFVESLSLPRGWRKVVKNGKFTEAVEATALRPPTPQPTPEAKLAGWMEKIPRDVLAKLERFAKRLPMAEGSDPVSGVWTGRRRVILADTQIPGELEAGLNKVRLVVDGLNTANLMGRLLRGGLTEADIITCFEPNPQGGLFDRLVLETELDELRNELTTRVKIIRRVQEGLHKGWVELKGQPWESLLKALQQKEITASILCQLRSPERQRADKLWYEGLSTTQTPQKSEEESGPGNTERRAGKVHGMTVFVRTQPEPKQSVIIPNPQTPPPPSAEQRGKETERPMWGKIEKERRKRNKPKRRW